MARPYGAEVVEQLEAATTRMMTSVISSRRLLVFRLGAPYGILTIAGGFHAPSSTLGIGQ